MLANKTSGDASKHHDGPTWMGEININIGNHQVCELVNRRINIACLIRSHGNKTCLPGKKSHNFTVGLAHCNKNRMQGLYFSE